MAITHVALVGHCGFDSGTLQQFAKQVAPLAQVSRVNDQRGLEQLPKPGTLLLVNRVLDGSFKTGGSGVDLIRELAGTDDAMPTMLVSNYEDAQQEAMDAGALRGFGKSHVADSNTVTRVADAIAGL